MNLTQNRLSSCRFCKRIAVFHEGQLVQVGSHEELVQDRNGKYNELNFQHILKAKKLSDIILNVPGTTPITKNSVQNYNRG